MSSMYLQMKSHVANLHMCSYTHIHTHLVILVSLGPHQGFAQGSHSCQYNQHLYMHQHPVPRLSCICNLYSPLLVHMSGPYEWWVGCRGGEPHCPILC